MMYVGYKLDKKTFEILQIKKKTNTKNRKEDFTCESEKNDE